MTVPELKNKLMEELERISGKSIEQLTRESSKADIKAIPFQSSDAVIDVDPKHHKILARIIDSTPTAILQSWGMDGPFWFVSFNNEPAIAFHVHGLIHNGYVVVTEWTKPGWYSCTLLVDGADKRLAVVAVKGMNLGLSIDCLVERGDYPEESYRALAYSTGIVDLRSRHFRSAKEIACRDMVALAKICQSS